METGESMLDFDGNGSSCDDHNHNPGCQDRATLTFVITCILSFALAGLFPRSDTIRGREARWLPSLQRRGKRSASVSFGRSRI